MSTNLLYTDVEDELRSSVRGLLAKLAPVADTIKRMESDEPYDPTLWRALAVDIGVTALAIPEDRGGHGASWREVAVVAEELGASITPTPFLGHTMATVAARVVGARDLIPKLVSGELTGTFAIGAATVSGPEPVHAENQRLTGSVRNVVDAIGTDVLVVPTDDGMHQVDPANVTITRVPSLDMTRPLCDLTFDGAPGIKLHERGNGGPPASEGVAGGGGGRDAALLIGGALLASEQVGIAQRCLDMTVDYLKTRYQFGRQIGSYQALKHRVADVWAELAQARAVARYAAACVADHDPDAPIATSLAQAYCSPVAVKAAEECVQLHGGTGFTWEHPAHLYLKRAKADSILLGTASDHRARLGQLVGILPS